MCLSCSVVNGVIADAVDAEASASVSEVATVQESIIEGSLLAEASSTAFLPQTSTVCYCVSLRLNIMNNCMLCVLMFIAE